MRRALLAQDAVRRLLGFSETQFGTIRSLKTDLLSVGFYLEAIDIYVVIVCDQVHVHSMSTIIPKFRLRRVPICAI
jgi:hypothetical protein